MKNIDVNYFPGWKRKSIAFTIDDGNLKLDPKFIEIVKRHKIKGTFNLTEIRDDPKIYLDLYNDFEIANHIKYHPLAFEENQEYEIVDYPYSKENAKVGRIHKTSDPRIFIENHGWKVVTNDVYCLWIDENKKELEALFGKGRIKDFVWPYHEMANKELFDLVAKKGYRSMRKTGEVKDSTNFDFPADRNRWSYNAHPTHMKEIMELYKAYPDDGKLKFFVFGLHGFDYEDNNLWGLLEEECAYFGDDNKEYYTAGVGELFAYEDAVKGLIINEKEIINNSDLDVYGKIDNKCVIIKAHSKLIY